LHGSITRKQKVVPGSAPQYITAIAGKECVVAIAAIERVVAIAAYKSVITGVAKHLVGAVVR
jgi:hypothetical protein